jgi:hypothetical protein
MKALSSLAAFAAGLLPLSAASASDKCDIAQIHSARDLHDLLGRRAVEIVNRAAGASWETDTRLTQLVARSAAFGLGAGDVGRPLGSGVSGARALAAGMKADTFRFLGWDYMDSPADACAEQKIEVEFINTRGKSSSQVEFTYKAGRVVAAEGWSRSLQSGSVNPVSAPH